jgi:hypothetical protein
MVSGHIIRGIYQLSDVLEVGEPVVVVVVVVGAS